VIESIGTIEIETERLRMRPLTTDDLDRIHYIWNDAGVRKYLWDDMPVSKELAADVLAQSISSFRSDGVGLWGVTLKGQDELIGFCGLRFFDKPPKVEALYGLMPEHWGKGLATEATRAMLRYGFEEIKLERIHAGADPPNQASFRVMAKAGMKFERRTIIGDLEAIYYFIMREDFGPDDSTYILYQAG
jgi:ribosomal-protein-alanine N-acetyltransferase